MGDAAQPDQAHMDKGLISSKGSTGPKRALLEDAELMGAAGGDLFGRDLLGDTSYEDGVQMLLGIVDENGPGRVRASIKTCYVSCTICLLLQLFMSVADLLLGAPVMGMGRGSYAGHAGWRLSLVCLISMCLDFKGIAITPLMNSVQLSVLDTLRDGGGHLVR